MFIIQEEMDAYYKDLRSIGNVKFTPREIDVIACILNGRVAHKEIATLLGITSNVVETHKGNINRKLQYVSRSNVRDFVEKSDKFSIVRNHYTHLLHCYAFEETLKRIAQINKSKGSNNTQPQTASIYFLKDKESSFLIGSDKRSGILAHLQLAGFSVDTIYIRDVTEHEVYAKENIIFVVSQSFINSFNTDSKIKSVLSFILSANNRTGKNEKENNRKDKNNKNNIFFLAIGEATPNNLISIIPNAQSISFKDNYYFSFLEFLLKLNEESNLQMVDLITKFKESYYKQIPDFSDHLVEHDNTTWKEHVESTNKVSNILSNIFAKTNVRIRMVWMIAMLVTAIVSLTVIYRVNGNNIYNDTATAQYRTIRSDLVMPVESVFLDRQETIKEIGSKFVINNKGIQAIALVGIGGAGKTTLARQYAASQEARVVWEINAETETSLRNSFGDLAQALAKTEEEKKELKWIQGIQDLTEKEKQIIDFAKQKLMQVSNWFLIYDNVETFASIQKYFPLDSETWGDGNIIITTRDSNIEHNSHINHSVHVGYMTTEQKYALFMKVFNVNSNQSMTQHYNEEQITEFLKSIPSFPLDVAIAAHYIKETNTALKQYLINLREYHADISAAQKHVLKEVGDYKNTRYEIISMSLEHILNSNKEFVNLLLCISLLDSQNIPRDLLDRYNKTMVVDSLIMHLKKYSLIISSSRSDLSTVFSLHRSTQDIMLDYLSNKLNSAQRSKSMEEVSCIFGNYIDDFIDKEDMPTLLQILQHSEVFADKVKGYSKISMAIISSKLCAIYHELGRCKMKPQILDMVQKNTEVLKQYYSKYYEQIARNLFYLGQFYSTVENNTQSQKFFAESLHIYEKHFPTGHRDIPQILVLMGRNEYGLGNYNAGKTLIMEGLALYNQSELKRYDRIAWTLTYLGNIHRKLGNYKDATDLLEEGIKLYHKHFSQQVRRIAWAYGVLGKVNRDMGSYTQATVNLTKCVDITRKDFGKDSSLTQWCYIHLGDIYRRAGNYKSAISTLDKSLNFYKQHAPQNYIDWCMLYIGVVYSTIGNNQLVRDFFIPTVTAYSNHFGKFNIKTSWSLVHLGKFYTSIKDYRQAQNFLEQGLYIYKKHFSENHIKIAWVQSLLGVNYILSGNYSKAKALLDKSFVIYEKHYGKDHLETARVIASIGHNHLMQGEMDLAEPLLNKAYATFKKAKHPDVYIVLELLSEMNLKKAQIISTQVSGSNQSNNRKAKIFKEQSLQYLQEALNIINEHVPDPDSSVHVIRIKDKIKVLTSEGEAGRNDNFNFLG